MKTDELPAPIPEILARRRRARAAFMLSKIDVWPEMRVLDIGCGRDGRSFSDHVPQDWSILGLDIRPPERVRHQHPGFSYTLGDARDLSRFADHEFDLAVSVGLFEHFADDESFARATSEMSRVARQYLLVVPWRYCWIEPHYGVPFFPLLPYSVQRTLVTTFDLSGHGEATRQNPDHIRERNRWRTNREYLEALPDARIHLTPTLETIVIARRAGQASG